MFSALPYKAALVPAAGLAFAVAVAWAPTATAPTAAVLPPSATPTHTARATPSATPSATPTDTASATPTATPTPGGTRAVVRVAVSGVRFVANVGVLTAVARTLVGGYYCAADGRKPTPLTALVEANRRYHLGGVRMRWDVASKDYVVTSIHGDVADGTRQWHAYVGKTKITTTPCRTAIKDRDKVTWKLEAPS